MILENYTSLSNQICPVSGTLQILPPFEAARPRGIPPRPYVADVLLVLCSEALFCQSRKISTKPTKKRLWNAVTRMAALQRRHRE